MKLPPFLIAAAAGFLSTVLLPAKPLLAAEPVVVRTVNDGNLVLEDVPEISSEVVDRLNRYQNVRLAQFHDWSDDGNSIYITTRFADVSQIHRVEMPGGARQQITFDNEPVGSVTRQPHGRFLVFSRDVGGSEFSQLYLLNPTDGQTTLLTDGQSRNGSTTWDRDGHRFAYMSTARNGASNDLWIMDPREPSSAKVIWESPDGTTWSAAEFSASGNQLLVANYVSITDSRVNLLDLDTGQLVLLAGGPDQRSANVPIAFDDEQNGFWFVTDQGSEFRRLAWQKLEAGSVPEMITNDLNWDVAGADLSHDRRRIAFTTNEGGMSRVYLMDTRTREYRPVENIPTGIVYGLTFSPDDTKLALTLSTATTPSDVFVLDLESDPLTHGKLTRWTLSEVGGLDVSEFRSPELISYPTFDTVDGAPRQIPAWVYKPAGEGPFPVVVSIHGGPEGQSRPGFSSTYQMWIDKLGVAVVVPNVRGSAGYGKTYLSLDNGYLREDSVRDIGALLDWIETQPDLDQDRVAVYGGSYGGYMVLASSVHYSDRLKAAVDIVGISNFVTFLENTQEYRRDLRRVEYGDERDPEMRKYLESIAPVNHVEKIRLPMLIVQGQNDPRVPVTEAEQIVAALRDAGQTVWYINALNEGHGFRKKENRDIFEQATVLFLQQHLVGE